VKNVSRWPGFTVVPTAMDGNCMFASIADQLHVVGIDSTKRSASLVRLELVEYMRTATDMHAVLRSGLEVNDTLGLSNYFSRMAQHGTWGDGNVLSAASRLYRRPVNVYREDALAPVVISESNNNSSETGINIAFVSLLRVKEASHYVSLVPSTSTTTTSAENFSGQVSVRTFCFLFSV